MSWYSSFATDEPEVAEGFISGAYLDVRLRLPDPDRAAAFRLPLDVRPLRIPLDCTDGFADAFYGRPGALLDPAVRRAQSAWSFVDDEAQRRFGERLRADLDSGAWDERHGHLRT
jgi:hypothetical protein